MLTRRAFAADAAAGLAALALAPHTFAKKVDQPLGVQLYTVRSLVDKDFPGTLAAIRKIGYRTVETYVAEYKMPAKDLRQAILDAGLTVPTRTLGTTTSGPASITPRSWAWNAWSVPRCSDRWRPRPTASNKPPINTTSGDNRRRAWA